MIEYIMVVMEYLYGMVISQIKSEPITHSNAECECWKKLWGLHNLWKLKGYELVSFKIGIRLFRLSTIDHGLIWACLQKTPENIKVDKCNLNNVPQLKEIIMAEWIQY